MGFESLLAGAAAAAGVAPTDPDEYNRWLTRVTTIAADLSQLAAAVQEHEGRKQECINAESDGTKKRFYGKLVNAKSIVKGSGEKTVTKGYLQFEARADANNVDEEGYEFIETAPLSTPAGSFEYERARSLVGQSVIVYKRLIPLANGRKARECAAIDPADNVRSNDTDSSPASRPAARPSQAPRPEAAPAAESSRAPSTPPPGPFASRDDGASGGDDLDAVMRNAEEVFDSAPRGGSNAAGGNAGGALAAHEPTSEEELIALAEQHLGKTAADVRQVLVEMYNVPEGKKLPSRQYTVVWREMAGVA
jgi:hypothetical protein